MKMRVTHQILVLLGLSLGGANGGEVPCAVPVGTSGTAPLSTPPGGQVMPTIAVGKATATSLPTVGHKTPPATQPGSGFSVYNELPTGSWFITSSRVEINGIPSQLRRKVEIVATKDGKGRQLVESKFNGEIFVAEDAVLELSPQDDREFDQYQFKVDKIVKDQKLKVAGKTLSCVIETYKITGPSSGNQITLTLWRCSDIRLPRRTFGIDNIAHPMPTDCIQSEMTTTGANMQMKGSRKIEELNRKLTVAGKDFSCLVDRMVSQGTANNKTINMDHRYWTSSELPGQPLRLVASNSVGKSTLESDVSVVDFHVPMPAAPVAVEAKQ